MDDIRYIHGVEFKKVAKLDDIHYEAMLKLYNINRSTKFVFDYELTDNEVEKSLNDFAESFKNNFGDLSNFLVHDANRVLKTIQLITDKELIDMTKIETYDEIYLYLTYSNVELFKDHSELNVLCEWDYTKKTTIKFKDGDYKVYRDNSDLSLDDSKLTQFEYLK